MDIQDLPLAEERGRDDFQVPRHDADRCLRRLQRRADAVLRPCKREDGGVGADDLKSGKRSA